MPPAQSRVQPPPPPVPVVAAIPMRENVRPAHGFRPPMVTAVPIAAPIVFQFGAESAAKQVEARLQQMRSAARCRTPLADNGVPMADNGVGRSHTPEKKFSETCHMPHHVQTLLSKATSIREAAAPLFMASPEKRKHIAKKRHHKTNERPRTKPVPKNVEKARQPATDDFDDFLVSDLFSLIDGEDANANSDRIEPELDVEASQLLLSRAAEHGCGHSCAWH